MKTTNGVIFPNRIAKMRNINLLSHSEPVGLCWSVYAGRVLPLSRSGVAPPTGTIHPRESRGTTVRKQLKDSSRSGVEPPPLSRSYLSRSGVAPPTGTIHPRESRGTTARKQLKKTHFEEIPFRVWGCVRTFSGVWILPVGGSTPDRRRPTDTDRPTQRLVPRHNPHPPSSHLRPRRAIKRRQKRRHHLPQPRRRPRIPRLQLQPPIRRPRHPALNPLPQLPQRRIRRPLPRQQPPTLRQMRGKSRRPKNLSYRLHPLIFRFCPTFSKSSRFEL